jgi:hypothetical protein
MIREITPQEEVEVKSRYNRMTEVIDSIWEDGDYHISTYFMFENGKELIFLEAKLICSIDELHEAKTFRNFYLIFRKGKSKFRKIIFNFLVREVNEDFYLNQMQWIKANSKHKDIMIKRKNS